MMFSSIPRKEKEIRLGERGSPCHHPFSTRRNVRFPNRAKAHIRAPLGTSAPRQACRKPNFQGYLKLQTPQSPSVISLVCFVLFFGELLLSNFNLASPRTPRSNG